MAWGHRPGLLPVTAHHVFSLETTGRESCDKPTLGGAHLSQAHPGLSHGYCGLLSSDYHSTSEKDISYSITTPSRHVSFLALPMWVWSFDHFLLNFILIVVVKYTHNTNFVILSSFKWTVLIMKKIILFWLFPLKIIIWKSERTGQIYRLQKELVNLVTCENVKRGVGPEVEVKVFLLLSFYFFLNFVPPEYINNLKN